MSALLHDRLLGVILIYIKAKRIKQMFVDLVFTEQYGVNPGKNYLRERQKRKSLWQFLTLTSHAMGEVNF